MSTSRTSLEILNPSIAELDRAEEEERKSRLGNGNTAAINAYKVADIVKNSDFPVVHGHQGSTKYFGSLEEQERSRRLANKEEANDAKVRASVLSVLVQDSTYPHIIPSHAGSLKYTRELEEIERERRITDLAEISIRKVRAQRISEGLRVNFLTIKARLVTRRAVTTIALQKGKEVIATATVVADIALNALPTTDQVASAAHTAADAVATFANKAYDALPTKAEVSNAANKAVDVANIATHAVADAAAPAVTKATNNVIAAGHTLSSFLPSVSSVVSAVTSFKNNVIHSVQHAYYGDEEIIMYKWSDISLVEEQERNRRISEDRDGVNKANSRMVSLLIMYANIYPLSKLSRNGGFNKHMILTEERERTRRLANKDEAGVREMNALKVSRLLTMLGWPFIRDAKFAAAQHFSETYQLEEEERKRRLGDDFTSFYARYNARKLASIIKDASLREDRAIIIGQIRKLEERERAQRISDAGLAIHNARKEARLIEDIGTPFFVGVDKTLLAKEETLLELNIAEEEERQYRIDLQKTRENESRRAAQAKAQKLAKMLSFSNASSISLIKQQRQVSQERAQDIALFVNQDTTMLEEKERKSRISDKYMQQTARYNANKVAGMIKTHNKRSVAVTPAPVAAAPVAPIAAPVAPIVAPVAQIAAPVAPIAAPVFVAPAPVFVAPAPVVAPVVAPVAVQAAPAPLITTTTTRTSTTNTVLTSSAPPVVILDQKLIDKARKQYEQEVKLAEKEHQKLATLSGKHGVFTNFRVHKHQHSENKHLANAQRHQEWLRAQESLLPAAPRSAGMSAF